MPRVTVNAYSKHTTNGSNKHTTNGCNKLIMQHMSVLNNAKQARNVCTKQC